MFMVSRSRIVRQCGLVLIGAVALGGCRAKDNPEVEVEIRSVGVDQASRLPVLVLQDKAKHVALPIWIGPGEAQAIATQLEGVAPPRPMTHDLIKVMLDEAGVEFQRVLIGDLKDSTYYAHIFLRSGRKDIEIDSRPSDAIALAVRFRKPIFIARSLLERDGAIDLRKQAKAAGGFTFAGITVQELTDDLASYFDVPPGHGVLVSDVARDVSAAVKRGDVIVELNGEPIADVASLQAKIEQLGTGAHADLAVRRGRDDVRIDLSIE
ncbi:MAG TPA: bifunctional nuclease domain-containing protein [Candidatus Binatia bacterium]|nr:bifunctional nuclease domain-containing protein [Candidatus Binatia bacterium]